MEIKKFSLVLLIITLSLFLFVVSVFLLNVFDIFVYSEKHIPRGFTLVTLPDTQGYTQSYPEIFTSQTQWIVDNKDSKNIIFVVHEGDIVDIYDSDEEWNNANLSMSILDNNIPYGILPGNHDMIDNGKDGLKDTKDTTYYNKYFPYTRYNSYSWYGGHYGNNNDNNYQLISYEGLDFLFLNIEFCPNNAVLAWASSIVENYLNRRVIITTHCYMNNDDTRVDADDKYNCNDYFYYNTNTNNGEEIWNNFIKFHENIFLVLSGHIIFPTHDGVGRRTDNGINGNQVHQLLANYQTEGNGWLRILEFKPNENKIYVSTYSPYLKEYKTDTDNQFILSYNMISAGSDLIKADRNILEIFIEDLLLDY